MRLHVTGATGYLGSELLRRAPEASAARVDVTDAGAVRRFFDEARPGAVIHTAYRQGSDDEWPVNVEGSANVARAAAAAGARLVHLSSDVVFSGLKGEPYVEADPPDPVNAYGRSKAVAEERVAAENPGALLVRTSLIYGGPAPSRHEQLAGDDTTVFWMDEIRSPIQVGDLAQALLELVEMDVAGPLHVAGADDVSRHGFAELVARGPRRGGPAPPGRPLDCRLDSSRAQALLRTRLRGIREVLG